MQIADRATVLRDGHHVGIALGEGVKLAVQALSSGDSATGNGGESRTLTAGQLEVAVLDRTRPRRKFRRLTDAQLEQLLA